MNLYGALYTIALFQTFQNMKVSPARMSCPVIPWTHTANGTNFYVSLSGPWTLAPFRLVAFACGPQKVLHFEKVQKVCQDKFEPDSVSGSNLEKLRISITL